MRDMPSQRMDNSEIETLKGSIM